MTRTPSLADDLNYIRDLAEAGSGRALRFVAAQVSFVAPTYP